MKLESRSISCEATLFIFRMHYIFIYCLSIQSICYERIKDNKKESPPFQIGQLLIHFKVKNKRGTITQNGSCFNSCTLCLYASFHSCNMSDMYWRIIVNATYILYNTCTIIQLLYSYYTTYIIIRYMWLLYNIITKMWFSRYKILVNFQENYV